jgi:hypothetical protein
MRKKMIKTVNEEAEKLGVKAGLETILIFFAGAAATRTCLT